MSAFLLLFTYFHEANWVLYRPLPSLPLCLTLCFHHSAVDFTEAFCFPCRCLSGFIPPSLRLCRFLLYFVTESLLLHATDDLFCLSSSLFGLFLPRFQLTELFFILKAAALRLAMFDKYSLTSGWISSLCLHIVLLSFHPQTMHRLPECVRVSRPLLSSENTTASDISGDSTNSANCNSSGAEVSNQHAQLVRCEVTQQRFYEQLETIDILSAI